MTTQIPLHSLVLMVGPHQTGKTAWASQHFGSHEIVSFDSIAHSITGHSHRTDGLYDEIWTEIVRRAEIHLRFGQRAAIDHTNLKREERHQLINLAHSLGVPVVFVLFPPLEDQTPGSGREARSLHGWRCNQRQIEKGDGGKAMATNKEGAMVVNSLVPQVGQDLLIVGDVHGNFDAMTRACDYAEKNKLFLVWLGDLVDYGPHNLKCVRLAHDWLKHNRAVLIWGNHERKIDRWIAANWGRDFRGRLSEASLLTIGEIESLNPERRDRFAAVWHALRSWSRNHLVVGNLLMTHGAAAPSMWTNTHSRLRGDAENMAMFGQVCRDDPTRADGYPNRVWHWVDQIPDQHHVVVGHDWLDRDTMQVTIKPGALGGQAWAIDTGCSKGGRLSGLHWRWGEHGQPVYFDT